MEADINILYGIIILIMFLLMGYIWHTYSRMNIQYMNPIESTEFPFPIYIINLDRKPERLTYVTNQLDNLNIKNYEKWTAVDGFNIDFTPLIGIDITKKVAENKGVAGCASSHVALWRHISDNKLDWTLILEDDAHLHPNFVSLFKEYWKNIPKDAKIIFPGFCGEERKLSNDVLVAPHAVMCTHAYLLSHVGARYLLDSIVPIASPIDVAIHGLFSKNGYRGSYIFNGNVNVNGVRPNDYKESNGPRCLFNGIIYQNQQDQGSTLEMIDTLYRYDKDS